MWFIDEALKKNKNYYNAEITKETIPDVALSVLYGQELFSNIFSRKDIWDEICIHLQRNKLERTDEILQIPDFRYQCDVLTQSEEQSPIVFN